MNCENMTQRECIIKFFQYKRSVVSIKTFATHIIISGQDASYIRDLEHNNDFHFDFRDDPSFSNWETELGDSLSNQIELSHEEISKYQSMYTIAKELLILTKDIEIAENVMNLVHGGMVLGYPTLLDNSTPPFCYEVTDDKILTDFYLKQSINERGLLGCLIALHSWKHEELIYSIEKFRFSISLDYFTPHSSHPRYGMMFSNSPTIYRSHVTASYALFTAYSIIEELGLEIRSSSDKKRFIDNQWNPIVKDDILGRLKKIGITDEDNIYWLQRGEPTEFQINIKPKLGIDSEYNIYEGVRDLKLKIYEALHYASYIRNFFVAHKFSKTTKYISPYDVNNIQCLARFLLLNRYGLWKINLDEIREHLSR
ncbi:hypothetical protein PMSD_03745 [Paenibacillus macquariensis subsp. defensor]|nr:hypothetical protein PMSD_03745 [Paenibacillus macquariensis subsp. defensor]